MEYGGVTVSGEAAWRNGGVTVSGGEAAWRKTTDGADNADLDSAAGPTGV